MKKLIFGIFIFLFFGTTLAYNPTQRDLDDLDNLKTKLDTLVVEDNIALWDFYDQLKNLETEYIDDERLGYMFANLKSYMYARLFTLKTASKVSSKNLKTDFVDQYSGDISVDIDDSLKNCTGWYNTLDDISFAYNIPTALTVATWYRESTCSYYLPSNGDGPFQIVNENYGTGDITEDIFVETIVDFAEFIHSKFDRYEGKLSGYISYTGFDMTGIVNFASLYNGGTKSGSLVLPNAPDYLYDGYGEEFSGASRYGILPQFIKTLDWEIENKY